MDENGKRLGFVGIMMEDPSQSDAVNKAISESRDIIVGRMGIPYRERAVSVITLVVNGTNDEVSALTGRLGRLPDVAVKSMLERNKPC